jgi:hypothetical protein
MKKSDLNRPSFLDARDAWKTFLQQRGLPTEFIWIFDENLCFERNPASPGGFHLGFQIIHSPPPPDAEQIAYYHFVEFNAPLVFYRLGSCRGQSVCLLLCDQWFASKQEADGFLRRDDWKMMFRPGPPDEIEEIKEMKRWENRMLRDRPLHELDFCMSLRAVHETLAHGRVLTAYEHYALKLLDTWHRFVK